MMEGVLRDLPRQILREGDVQQLLAIAGRHGEEIDRILARLEREVLAVVDRVPAPGLTLVVNNGNRS